MRKTLLLATTICACAGTPKTTTSDGLVSGVDLENFDPKVPATEDFYHHVNGKWLERTEIPADRSNYGSFTKLLDEAEANLKAIIEDAAAKDAAEGTEAQKVGDFFKSFMDSERLDKLGLEPLRGELTRIYGLSDKAQVAEAFGRLVRIGARSPVSSWIDQDAKKSTEYIVYLSQSGLGLPDRDYYFDDKDEFKKYRKAYRAYLEATLKLSGVEEPAASSEAPLLIETALAEHHWTRTQNRDRDKTYNKLSLDELATLSPNFDVKAFFVGAKVPTPSHVIIRQPTYFENLSKIIDETPLHEWKLYLAWSLIDAMAPILDKSFVDAEFAFRKKTLRGIEENRPRWKRAVSSIDGSIGHAVGKIYVEKHFKPEAKARMKTLVENLVKAFEEGIDGLEWMTPKTKEQARAKLARFTTKIGYPDEWLNYADLEIKADDLYGNVTRAHAFEHDRWVSKLGGPIDRGHWYMTPQTVNAYYNPPMNEIVFPAAILQPPFFDMSADDAVNYGAIGAVIGHELSHGFDDQGRKSDGDGNLRDWWTEEDATEFNARADLMVKQYDQFEPMKDQKVQGKLTLGENIGDLGGLTIAFKAYQRSLGGKAAPHLDGYSGAQRFFIGWAQIWRRKYRDAELQQRLVTDPHSPSQYRVIGVLSNMPEFYEAFDISEGDPMHRPDGERVKIW